MGRKGTGRREGTDAANKVAGLQMLRETSAIKAGAACKRRTAWPSPPCGGGGGETDAFKVKLKFGRNISVEGSGGEESEDCFVLNFVLMFSMFLHVCAQETKCNKTVQPYEGLKTAKSTPEFSFRRAEPLPPPRGQRIASSHQLLQCPAFPRVCLLWLRGNDALNVSSMACKGRLRLQLHGHKERVIYFKHKGTHAAARRWQSDGANQTGAKHAAAAACETT